MTDLNPTAILKMYRTQSSAILNEQVAKFSNMAVSDRMELLFYMIMHQNEILRHVHKMVAPEEANIIDMPEQEKGH